MSSVYRIGEFAAKVGRSPSSIRRWESEGRLDGLHRYEKAIKDELSGGAR